ncbi:MAG: gliding motility-associated C-terminal domain-containing protein [Filimonas sp.]|nr:gliding motility-associated C-terminal domain-containing protein [Filimonas sp.]
MRLKLIITITCFFFLIIAAAQPLVFTIHKTDITCAGANNGSANAIAAGGTAPYRYLWSTGATTASISNLPAGNYSCTTTDNAGTSITKDVVISQPLPFSINISKSNVGCNGASTGSIALTTSGGTAPYTYLWETGETTSTLNNLSAGQYACTITDANGCDTAISISITQATQISFATRQINIKCNGDNNGIAYINVSGGIAPYSYLWSNGAPSSSLVNDLGPGTYTCVITDANGCDTTTTVTISEPAKIQYTLTQTNVLCSGDNTGSLSLATSGGTTPYTYEWSTGATTNAISSLTAGSYTFTITDKNGCDTSQSVTVTEPDDLSYTISKTNVLCYGAATGSATITVTGGVAPYAYVWSSGSTTATANNLAAGVYTCTITDVNGCSKIATVAITQSPQMSYVVNKTNVRCNGAATGAATIIVSGGASPYTYLWSTGSTAPTVSNLAAGTYTCSITDANGCDSTITITFTQASAFTVTKASTNVTCNNGSDGTATLTVTGATSPYSYNWFPVTGNTANIANLSAGAYSCTITDANGCDTTISVLITQPPVISYSTAQTNVLCNGATTGGATLTVSGGTAPYTYNWSNGSTTPSISNVATGNYTCTITDVHGCDTTAAITITEPSALITNTTQTDVRCHGAATGAASVIVSGGVSPYTYNWSNGATTASISGLTAGSYMCTITDANGCTTTASVTITEAAQIIVTTIKTDVKCNLGSDGSITMVVNGGVFPYIYSWSNGATTANISGLTAGSYTCTITDANGCIIHISVTIGEPAKIAFTSSQTNILCYGTSTGTANLSVSGGTPPYTYNWSNGATSSSISNVIAGAYTCSIRDANGCDTTATITITQTARITFTKSQVNIDCNGNATGSATVNVTSGGTTPYVYQWAPSGGVAATANGLTAGAYTCSITDANGCDTTVSFTMTQPSPLTATANKSNITCNGANDGTATAIVSGGVPPYTYFWIPGRKTTVTITNLDPGTYTGTATDANGCTFSGTVAIVQPTLLTGFATHTNVTCNGASNGMATATASGGTSPYTYSWSNGGTTATINNLPTGIYTCTITDANGCTTVVSTTVSQPSALEGSVSVTDVTCNGINDGTATVNPSGGSALYSYRWSTGGTTQTINNLAPGIYTVTITDHNGCTYAVPSPAVVTEPSALAVTTSQTNVGCNGKKTGIATVNVTGGTAPYAYSWSPNGGTGATATGLGAGTYTCTVIDASRCIITTTVTITEKTMLTGSFSKTDVSCTGASDGAATASVSGGTTPYTYAWTPGGGTTATINNLPVGTYTCVVIDANRCVAIGTVNVQNPPLLKANIDTHTDVTCNGSTNGTAHVNVAGGTAPYTYNWSPAGGTSATATGLGAGTYTCTVTDANGCSVTTTQTYISETSALNANVTYTNGSSPGANDGTATASPSGGTAPYAYSWSPGGQTTSSIFNLPPGSYTCTVTDVNSCTSTQTIVITEPTILAVTTSQTNISCNGATDGSATVHPAGGTAPYTYNWSPGGAATASISNLAPGTYTCTITDANAVQDMVSVTIIEPAPVTADVTETNVLCNGSNTGAATITPHGGSNPYSYAWSPSGGNNATASSLVAGNYSCLITDARGCTASIPVTINTPAALTVSTTKKDMNCAGFANGYITVSPSGGVAPYIYAWSPSGGNGATASGLSADTYTCTITDANGCPTTSTVTITEPVALTANTTQANISCHGGSNGSSTAVISGGTLPYTYVWVPNNATTVTITNLTPGTYTANVTDANGCKITSTADITQPPKLVASISITRPVSCNGATDAIAIVNRAGGVAPYTYLWSTGATSQIINQLAPGSYSCQVTDANNCVTSATSITISEPAVVSAIISKTDVVCYGGATGSIILSGTGGTAPYTYSWNTGATTASINNLTAGSYICVITDSRDCTGQITVAVAEPSELVVDISKLDVTCNGSLSGAAAADVSGGTSPYAYQWTPSGGTGDIATGLGAGTYTCTVTDFKGCIASSNTTIAQPDVLIVAVTQVNVSCKGANDATVTLTPAGGTPGYTYSWSTGATTAQVANLAPGTQTYTVTDLHLCSVAGAIDITEPTALQSSSSHTNVSCYAGNNGTVGTTASGGTAPYTYLWTPGNYTTATVSGLPIGSYTCVTTDYNGCTISTSATIAQPTPFAVTVNHTNISCNGSGDGNASVNVSGASPPYTYNWSNGGTTATISNLTPGIYSCNIIDSHGCDTTINTLITQPTVLSFTTNKIDVLCNGFNTGVASVIASGGSSPYTYSWSNGGTTATITNLAAGTYTCLITDVNGCNKNATITITQPTAITFTTGITNVLCNGGNTGIATVFASGGTGPYTYSWSNGATTQTINNLAAGTYICVITDANGCNKNATITITQPAALSTSFIKKDVDCNGNSTGDIALSVTGGKTPYSYTWSNGTTSASIHNLPAGNYNCIVTDANGCTTSVNVAITEPDVLDANISAYSNLLCSGDNSGSATVTVIGGTTPYTYNWSPDGKTTATISGLAAGSYHCAITDAQGCTTGTTATLTQPSVLLAVISAHTNVNCNGGNNGSLTATPSGGTASYSYQWSNGATTATASNLAAGNYTCTITDAHGCTTTVSDVITQPSTLSASTSFTNLTCKGDNTGSAKVTAGGGTAPYTYNWSNGATTASISNVPAGNYNCTITDSKGCSITANVIITEPAELTANATSVTNLLCNGDNTGSATVNAAGGTMPYNYSWTPGGDTTATISGRAAGTYNCIVTDAHGCVAGAAAVITQPDALTAVTIFRVNVHCNGGNNGRVTAIAMGGTMPYTYRWSNGAATRTITNLTAGTYTCLITDAHGCTTLVSTSITEPAALSTTTSQTNVDCNGNATGIAIVQVSGGTTPYTYLWSNGATGATATNLAAGNYNCTITDNKNCSTTANVTITEPGVLSASISAVTNLLCNNDNSGNTTVAVSGGTVPYQYNWTPGGGTTATISSIAAGLYIVAITDAHGCTTNATAVVTQPDLLTATVTDHIDVSCNNNNDGRLTVLPAGGTLPYAYLWSNGATSATISNLAAGNYSCTITDAHGCTTAITATITAPPVLNATAIQTNVDCNGSNTGAANITVTGGTLPYTYQWSNGASTAGISNVPAGTYSCTITDAHGCIAVTTVTITEPLTLNATVISQNNLTCNGDNSGSATIAVSGGTAPYTFLWSNGATSAAVNNLAAGNYSCTVTDAHGCTTNVLVIITQPNLLTATITSHTDASCNSNNDGQLTILPSGGTAPYTFLWSNGVTSATINNLAAGNYSCTVTDAHGCATTLSATITEPAALTATTTQTNVDCNGNNTGAATVTISGGTAPYTYLWSNGTAGATINNIGAGIYTCIITDAHSCVITATVTITESAPLDATISKTNIDCNGALSGAASVSASGGTAPYNYLWSNGATTQALSNIAAGSYTCTITDANGCRTKVLTILTEPAALNATASGINAGCYGATTGSASVTTNGGTAPYSYLWSNNAATATINNIAAGVYTCTITDANGCNTTASALVTEPPVLASTTSLTNVDCNGNTTGMASANASGGTAPYSYLWSTGATTASINSLPAGRYSYIVIDANACTTTTTVIITQPTALVAATNTPTSILCNGDNTGSASVTASGGIAPYNYNWSNGSTSATINELVAGKYVATVTDANGCGATDSVTIASANFSAVKTVTDEGNDGTVTVNELLTYTIRLKNNGPNTLDSIIITDAIPANTRFVSSTTGAVDNNVLLIKETNFSMNEERTYTIVVRANASLTGVTLINNIAEVKNSNSAVGKCIVNAAVTIPVYNIPPVEIVDLGIEKQVDQKAVTVGDNYNYTLLATNVGITAKNVVITDTIPTQLNYITNSTSEGFIDYNANSRVLTWSLDSIRSGAGASLSITVRAMMLGTVLNATNITNSQKDTNQANNRSAVAKNIIPFKIPNVITPNSDGHNDKFVIDGLELYPENELIIFNRWAANVYQQKNYKNDWDGGSLNAGTYYYTLKLRDSNGAWHEYNGYLMIMKK